MSSIPLQNHRFEDICPQRISENHRFENIGSPFLLKIVTSGHTCSTLQCRGRAEHMFRTHVSTTSTILMPGGSRTVTSPVRSTCCGLGVHVIVPLENHKFDDICRRAPLQIMVLRTHVLVPHCKSQIREHMSSLRLGNYGFEVACPRLPLKS